MHGAKPSRRDCDRTMLKESEYWNEVGKEWDGDLPNPLWRRHSDAVNRALLARWLPAEPVGSILKTDAFDEACGAGLIALLRSRGRHVMEMDLSTTTLAGARAKHPDLHGVVADARGLPFASGSFDIVVSNSTLDHFRTHAELQTSLGELHRVLRPGGQMLLTLDNPLNPIVALRNVLPFGLLHRARVLPYYVGATAGRGRLRKMLETIGFEVKEIGAILHCPRILAILCAGWMTRHGSPRAQERFLSGLLSFERLSRWPTRFFSGYFTAVWAVKRQG